MSRLLKFGMLLGVLVIFAILVAFQPNEFTVVGKSVSEGSLSLLLEDIAIFHNAVDDIHLPRFFVPLRGHGERKPLSMRESLTDAQWSGTYFYNLRRFQVWFWGQLVDDFKLCPSLTEPCGASAFIPTNQDSEKAGGITFRAATTEHMHLTVRPFLGIVFKVNHHPSTFNVTRCGFLTPNDIDGSCQNSSLNQSDDDERECKVCQLPLYCYVFVDFVFIGLMSRGIFLFEDKRYIRGTVYFLVGSVGVLSAGTSAAFCDPLFWRAGRLALSGDGDPYRCWNKAKHNGSDDHHSGISVTQQYVLTSGDLCITLMAIGRQAMATVLSTDKQIAVIGALAEGSSIRSIERTTGIHRDTIMRLGVKVGQGCAQVLNAKMRDLDCRYLQFDEIWGFIGKKERSVMVEDKPDIGDVWTFCAVDADTKLVPLFKVGKRDRHTANAFVQNVAGRMRNRVQISTDALRAYVEAIEKAFGADVDYGQIVKTYTHDESEQPNRRYSAPQIVSSEKKRIVGAPDMRLISTSYIERLNATTRLHMRRLTRLTLAFSKKRENFEAAVALHFAYYNLVKRHNAIRCTPAMAAGIERDFWSVGDLIEAAA